MALKSDGTVMAWGLNGYGQLGDGTTIGRPSPTAVLGLTGATVIAAGGYHTVARKNDGTVAAWGLNNHGQLGDGTNSDRLSPVTVPGLTGVTAVAAGYYHTVALKNDGTVVAWGRNGNGQLGDGSTTDRLSPTAVPGLTGVAAIAAGGYHTVAVKFDGAVVAWGFNLHGQLGEGTAIERLSPVAVPGLTGVTAIAAGAFHTVAMRSDGAVVAWGYNLYGQLGSPEGSMLPHAALVNLDVLPPLVTPDHGTGTYIGSVTVTLSCSDHFTGCNGIYYTEDGTTPTTTSTLYTVPLTASSSTTLTFMAQDLAGNQSGVQNAAYTIIPSTYSLALIVTGGGTINAAASPPTPDMNCSGSCGQSYSVGTVVTLTARPDVTKMFGGWSGACNGNNLSCSVTMNAVKTVTASFVDTGACFARLGQVCYGTLGEAYEAVPLNTTAYILAQAGAYAENLILDRPVTVTFQGGYDNSYTSIIGSTTLQMSEMNILNGSLTFDSNFLVNLAQ